jgi:hypothetical protein
MSKLAQKNLWADCVQATGKQAVWLHSLSTTPAGFILTVPAMTDLHTLLQHATQSIAHRINDVNNRLKTGSFHTFHLAYYYNYTNIYKSSKGLTQ